MKNLCAILFLTLCFSSPALAQNFDWAIVADQGSKQNGNAIAVDSSRQCVYVVGQHDSDFQLNFDYDGISSVYSGNPFIPHDSNQDGFLMKFSFDGELLWYNYFTGAGEQIPTGVDLDHHGNVYVTGIFKNFLSARNDSDEELFAYSGIDSGNSNIFVASFNPEGEARWFDQQGGENDDFAMDIAVDGDNVYVAGIFTNQNTSFHGYDLPDSFDSQDVFLLNYDLSGSYNWFSVMSSSEHDYNNDLDMLSSSLSIEAYNDHVYILGAWSGTELLFYEDQLTERAEMALTSVDNSQDFFVAAINSDGEYQWTVPIYQQTDGGFGYAITADCDGVYVGLTIGMNSSSVVYPDGSGNSRGDNEILLMKLNPETGMNEWEILYDTPGNNDEDVVRGLAADGHGNLYAVGWFDSPFIDGFLGLGTYYPADKKDIFVIKLKTASGDEDWIERFGGQENDKGISMGVAGQNTVFITGMVSGDIGSAQFDEDAFEGDYSDNFVLYRMSDSEARPLECCNLNLSSTNTDLSCHESNDGEINVLARGTMGTVNYSWSPQPDNVEGGLATGLSAGTYTIDAVDGSGCSASLTVTINEPDQIVTENSSITDASCPDTHDGVAEFKTTGQSGNGSLQVFDSPIVSVPAVSNSLVGDTAYSTLSNLMPGEYEVFYEADNGCTGDTLTINIAGVDTIAPVLECTTDTLTYYVDGSCDFTPNPSIWFADLNPVDNCSDSFSYNSTILNPGGVWTENIRDVLLEVEDEYGNTATCEIHFEVLDTIAPSITCISDQTITLSTACDVNLPDYTGMVTASDGCPNVTVTQSPASGTVLSGHGTVQEVTMTATDESGNATTCSFDVTLEDDISPSITCPGDINEPTDAGCNFAIPDYTGLATNSDNCDADVDVTQSPAVGTIISSENTTQTITLTATDNAGNTNDCSFVITLIDDIAPSITCPGDFNEATDSNCDFSIPDYTSLASTSDNCDADVEVTQSPIVGTTISGRGTTQTITLTAEDNAGNMSSCSFVITLIDDIAPSITCPGDINEPTDAGCNFSIPDYTSLATTSDNCDTDVDVTQSPAVGVILNGETTTQIVTLTAEDDAGNTTDCSFVVTLIDDIDPSITEPADRNESTDSNCDFSIPDYTGLVTTSDNCDTEVDVTQSPAEGTVLNGEGTTQTITLTATDNAGNTAQSSFIITLIDDINPTITCPSTQTYSLDADCEFTVPDLISLATFSDNCDADLDIVQSPAPGDTIDGGAGTYSITLTATDNALNSATCSFDIELEDDLDPTFDCPADDVLDLTDSCSTSLPDYTMALNEADNCSIQSITQTPGDGTEISTTTMVTIEVTDINNNVTSCTFEVSLEDVESPEFDDFPGDMNESTDSNCDFSIPDYTGFATTSDNCDADVDVTQSPAVGTVLNGVGTTQTITLTATDNAGNTAQSSFVVTLIDDIDPTITCPSTQTYSLDADCEFTVPDLISLATFSDNCDADLDIVQSPAPGDTIDGGAGTYSITLTATDNALNSATCSFDIELEDDLDPTFDCPADDVLNLTDSCSTSLPDYTMELNEADNCGIQSITQTPVAGTEIFTNTTVTIDVTDINNNTASCSFEVTLEDVESPQFDTCPADTIFIDLANQCDYLLEDFTTQVGATDNCAVVDLVQSPASSSVTLQGNSSQSVTITATDDAENSSICSFVVATVDDTAPVITDYPADQTFDKDENCGFVLPDFTGDVTYNEPCTATVTQSPEANEFLTADSTEVTLTVTDPYGNSSESSFYVYLEDTEAPTLTCNDLTIEVASCPIALPNFADSMLIEDNCEIASIDQSITPGDFVMPGDHEITLTAYDNSGNSNTCTFIVTYEDLTAPEIICPDDIVESAAPGQCGKIVTFDDPVDSDNCDVDNVEQIQGPSSGSFFEVGETLIEYEVTDFSGNTNTCSFTITVTDDEAPELTCPDDIIQCEQTVNFDAPTYSDNCEISTFEQTSSTIFQSGDTFPIGVTTLEYTAEDIHGNVSTCSFTITVEEPIETELPDFPEGFCPDELPVDISSYVDSELNWTWIEGTDFAGFFNQPSAGVYNLNFTAEIGTCFEEFNRELEVYPAALADAGPDLEVCGDMRAVDATTSGSEVTWTISSSVVDANPSQFVEDPMLIANEFGSYNLTLDVVTENGCTAQDAMSVSFYEMPGEPDAGEDFDFDFRYEVVLEGSYQGAGDISWRRVAGQGILNNENIENPMVTNLGEGTNIFEMRVSNGVCPTTRDSVIVIVNGLNIPTGFSPNGDNTNDRYVIRGIENSSTNSLKVFNRWGNLVYEVENYDNDWEGQSRNGNPLPEDTYFYVLEINETLNFRGYIVIRR